MEVHEIQETITLADEYLKYGVLNPKSRDDRRHIAIATVTECKYIVSWNFKHFVNIKTINKVQAVHQIRYENYEETKNMQQEELIEKTRRDAEKGKKLLEELRNKFQKQVPIKNI